MSRLSSRRLRAGLSLVSAWTLGGIAAGAAFGAVLGAGLYLWHAPAAASDLRLLPVALGIAGGIAGLLSGVGFVLLLARRERARDVDALRLSRLGAWGALASAITGFLISRDPTFTLLCAGVGFGAGAGTLAVARRGLPAPAERRELLLEGE